MAKKFTPKPPSKIGGEQNEFYAVFVIILLSFKNYISQFTLFKAMYTLTYIANLTTELMTAAAIPFFQARNDAAERLREQLMLSADQCLAKWQNLKRYIIQAYPENLHKTSFESAGIEFYEQALKYNWEKLSNLMSAAAQFITEHSTELLAGNNMPATFQAELDTLRANTFSLYTQFEDKINASHNLTIDKINANNELHRKLMLICKDGQQIFRHDPGKRAEFVYSKILERVRGASSAFQEFEVPKSSSIKIKKLVANTPFANIGETELVVCIGDVSCTVGTGSTVPVGATIIMQEGVTTITVLNTNTEHKGKCKVRVIKK